jgi:hypothetical protein
MSSMVTLRCERGFLKEPIAPANRCAQLSRICLAQSGIDQRPGFFMEGFAYKVGAVIVVRVTTRVCVISTIVKASRTAVKKSPRCNAPHASFAIEGCSSFGNDRSARMRSSRPAP